MTPQQIVDLLNEGFKADPGAMHALVINRTTCNLSLGEGTKIHVDARMPGYYTVDMLGVLNGIVGLEGEFIDLVFTKEKHPRFMGFKLRGPEPMCKGEQVS